MSALPQAEASPLPTPTMHRQIEPSTTSVLEVEHQLVAIEPDELGSVWDLIEPFMFEVIDGCNGRHTMESLISEITNRELALWAVVGASGPRALVGTQILVASSGLRSLTIRFTVGKGLHAWIGLLDDLEDYARSQGCTRVETYSRKGWAKHMPDYKLTHILLEKDL